MLMNKRVISFLVALTFVLFANAQINNNILNLNLGVSTKTEAKRVLSSNNCNIISESAGDVVTQNMEFCGITWAETHFMFMNDKLYNIVFALSDKNNDDTTLKKLRLYLDKSFYDKYSKYIKTNKDQLYFFDGKTKVSTEYFVKDGTWILTLTYTDIQLLKDYVNKGHDDI